MPDRSWEHGLQQMIEAKEGCLISEQREPLARISYQRFLQPLPAPRRHLGHARRGSSDELQRVYGLNVRRVAPHRPS